MLCGAAILQEFAATLSKRKQKPLTFPALALCKAAAFATRLVLCSCSSISLQQKRLMGTCVITDRPATSLHVPPGRACASMCAVTLRRAHFEIPMQLLFCIASHMAGTINTGSNCSSQPAKVQNRENDGDRGWAGRGGKDQTFA